MSQRLSATSTCSAAAPRKRLTGATPPLREHTLDVVTGSRGSDPQALGGLARREAADQQAQDLALPPGQPHAEGTGAGRDGAESLADDLAAAPPRERPAEE